MNREQKISFLKRLYAGKTTIKELIGGRFKVFIDCSGAIFSIDANQVTKDKFNRVAALMCKNDSVKFKVTVS